MHTGMLWFDNSEKPLPAKVQAGVDYYQKKHGSKPTLVLVNPAVMDGQKTIEVDKIIVRGYHPVLPGHIWIGIEDKAAK